MASDVLGLDIGGANLKAASNTGAARSRPFAVWRQPDRLGHELQELLVGLPAYARLAVTMTAELCDCYVTREEGVNAVLNAVEWAAGPTPVMVWQTDGRFVSIEEARRNNLKAAAANWLALATFAGRYAPEGTAVLVDVGSTTTDLVGLVDGRPVPRGRTDFDRLLARELVYMGVSRTPLFALLPTVTIRGAQVRPAAEWFATTRDAYLLLKQLPEQPADTNTADGRPATRTAAHARIARVVCGDRDHVTLQEAVAIAEQARQRQIEVLREHWQAVTEHLPAPPRTVILAGSGEFLARQALADPAAVRVLSLAEKLGPAVSESACAYAVAVLAAERLR